MGQARHVMLVGMYARTVGVGVAMVRVGMGVSVPIRRIRARDMGMAVLVVDMGVVVAHGSRIPRKAGLSLI